MNKKNTRKGFTIVELVIVIAVIAILAAVLIPTFGNVIEKANDSAAVQEAKNTYTNYVAEVDYAAGAKAEDDLIIETTKGFVLVVGGSVQDEVYDEEADLTADVLKEAFGTPETGKKWAKSTATEENAKVFTVAQVTA